MKRQLLAVLLLLVIAVLPAAAFNLTGAPPKATEPPVYLANAGGAGSKAGEYAASSFNVWPPQGWTLTPASGTGAWAQGSLKKGPDFSPDSGALGTLKFAEFNSYDWAVGTVGDLISPTVTLPNPATDCSLSFYAWNHWYATAGYNYDTVTVSVTTNGGSNWTVINKIYGDINDWTYRSFPLEAYAGQDIQIKFHAWSDYGASDPSIDEVKIGRKPAHDVALTSITAPGASMDGATSPVAIVSNLGTGAETFEVVCTIDSSGTIVYADTKYVTGLAAGAQQTVTFVSYLPALGNGKIYTATFNTVLAGDGDPYNDTLKTSFNTYSVQRTVVAMDFTALWCTWCPWHQVAWKRLKAEAGDTLCVMGMHSSSSSDSFYVLHCADMYNYYTPGTGLPTSMMDGIQKWVGSDTAGAGNSQYNAFRAEFNQRKLVRSPFALTFDGVYNGNTGTLNVTTNYPGTTPIPVTIRVAIIEFSKHTHWPPSSALPQDSIYDFVRDMLPASAGDTFNVTGGTITRNYPFTLNAGWNKTKLGFVVWAESRGLKENLQSGEIDFYELTGVSGEPTVTGPALKTQLLPCFPNPGSDRINISYNLQADEQVSLAVYDITGRLVQTLVNGKQTAGSHSVAWNGCNERGQKAASGIYFYKLTTGTYSAVKKLTMLK